MKALPIFSLANKFDDIKAIFEKIGVDREVYDWMAKRADFAIYFKDLKVEALRILKQEALHVGAECAISYKAITNEMTKGDALLLGRVWDLENLYKNLKFQTWFGLDFVREEIKKSIKLYYNENYFDVLGKKIEFPLIMGIVNVTPDSFSDGGLAFGVERALNRINEILPYVDIIDIGGESTRPGADFVSLEEEEKRVLPVVEKAVEFGKVVSVDTRKYEIAKKAVSLGARIINDVSGFSDERMFELLAENEKVWGILMHMKGIPKNMQNKPYYEDVLFEIFEFFEEKLEKAKNYGVENRIIFDPGIGFGKRLEDNLKLIKFAKSFKVLNRPLCYGLSRKSFIKMITGEEDPLKRVSGTIAATSILDLSSVEIHRVHDCYEIRQALEVTKAIKQQTP